MIEQHTHITEQQLGTLEIGPGHWQALGRLLDQLPSTADGARYLATTDATGSGKTIAELIEAGEILNVIEQLSQYLDQTSRS